MVRFKNRYLVCEVVPARNNGTLKITQSQLFGNVRRAVGKAYGDYGLGLLASSLCVKYWNSVTRMVMIRARREAHQMVQQSLTFIKSIENTELCFKTLHVGGTIRTCSKFLIKHQQKELRSLLSLCKTEDERNKVKKSILKSNVTLNKSAQSKGRSQPVVGPVTTPNLTEKT